MTRSTGFGLFAMIAALVAYLASLSFLQLLAGVSLRSPTRPPADCVDLEGRSGWGLSGSVGSHQQMSRLGIAFIAFATVLWAAPASAHGCHLTGGTRLKMIGIVTTANVSRTNGSRGHAREAI
jgi:hypothetical protein